MFLNNVKTETYRSDHSFIWDKVIKREIVLKAYSETGDSYLNLHLFTWDNILLTFFAFRNAKTHKYLEMYDYSLYIAKIRQ